MGFGLGPCSISWELQVRSVGRVTLFWVIGRVPSHDPPPGVVTPTSASIRGQKRSNMLFPLVRSVWMVANYSIDLTGDQLELINPYLCRLVIIRTQRRSTTPLCDLPRGRSPGKWRNRSALRVIPTHSCKRQGRGVKEVNRAGSTAGFKAESVWSPSAGYLTEVPHRSSWLAVGGSGQVRCGFRR
jgi:hypothetical protein